MCERGRKRIARCLRPALAWFDATRARSPLSFWSSALFLPFTRDVGLSVVRTAAIQRVTSIFNFYATHRRVAIAMPYRMRRPVQISSKEFHVHT